MRIACVAFTENGLALARRLRDGLAGQGDDVALSCSARLADALAGPDPGSGSGPELDSESGPDPSSNPGSGPSIRAVDDVRAWAAEAWATADALLFVGACGIAVRAVAPLVADKFSDPAVVCVDDAGTFAVPVLGGHVGGANRLARHVAGICGARAVVTTATDVNHVFAVDAWAAERDLAILDREVAKEVSAALLRGERVGFANDADVDAPEAAGIALGDAAASCTLGVSVSLDPERRPFARTLRLVPHTVVVGVGCRRGTEAQAILAQVDACLREAHVAPEAVCAIASIDAKADEPGLLEAARIRGWELRLYDADRLAAVPGDFASSEFVRETVGVDNVCERAACVEGATLLLPKRAAAGVTVALAALGANAETQGSTPVPGTAPVPGTDLVPRTALVTVVGLGPGARDDMTLRAHRALLAADVIVGFATYVDLVRDAYPHAEFVSSGMRGEERRCRMALERAAAGQRVAVVCSGDPGVYGMAGLLLELAPGYPGVEVEVVPGVTAATGGAAVLGAPLMDDWCTISLSDLMTPWHVIERRLRAVAAADICVVLYNPGSRGRTDHLRRACDILLESRAGSTVCGVVRNVGRAGQSCATCTLDELRTMHVDMLTCVFVGSSRMCTVEGRMVTPRGYERARDSRGPIEG